MLFLYLKIDYYLKIINKKTKKLKTLFFLLFDLYNGGGVDNPLFLTG